MKPFQRRFCIPQCIGAFEKKKKKEKSEPKEMSAHQVEYWRRVAASND